MNEGNSFVVDRRDGTRTTVQSFRCGCKCCEHPGLPGSMGLYFDPEAGRWKGYCLRSKADGFDEDVSMFMNVLRQLNCPETVKPDLEDVSSSVQEEKVESLDTDTPPERKTVVNVATRQSGTVGVFWYARQQAWNAQCFKDGRTFGKMFYVREHGDEEALRLAISWRQHKIEAGQAGRKRRLAPKYQSGVKGVQWHKVNETWLCRWVEGGKQRSKTFKPGDYNGVAPAMKAAVEYRKEIEKRLYCFR